MSWIIQTLLSNKTKIKEKSTITQKEYKDYNYGGLVELESINSVVSADGTLSFDNDNDVLYEKAYGYDDPRITDDDFNDLILIEKAIKKLSETGLLSTRDLDLIEYVADGNSFSGAEKRFGKHRNYLVKDFQKICDRIAFYLGGYFTDDGYIHFIAKKYRLTEEQVSTLKDFIKSRFRHKILRNSLKSEKENDDNKRNVQTTL